MSVNDNKEKNFREFKLTSLALKNKNTVFLMTAALLIFGLMSYIRLPKELMPDVVIPTVLVQTIYPGNPPVDIENLITRPIEKEVETVKGVKEVRSTSSQDFSMVFVEFQTNVPLKEALTEVKDAVDKAKSELPNDLLDDPVVEDIDFSEFPILNINLSGDFSLIELKTYAEYLEDELESIYEISKVEITGINEREIKVHLDPHKLEMYELTFQDVENAIAWENVSIAGGELRIGGTRRAVRTIGEFEKINEIENIIVKNEDQNIVYVRDIGVVIDGYEDPSSIARLNDKPVVSLQVIKKSGENILETTDQIYAVLEHAGETGALPADMEVTITNDLSEMVRGQLSNLENSIILGMIFVMIVLFYFIGTKNALFVGIAIPTSMFISFVIISLIGFKINMMVLFSLILALGMLVDNAIVVVENIYRWVDKGFTVTKAARMAVGEIAMPIISSTATTLAAFFPLVFWNSLEGEFMKYLPITLIIVLASSLFVALVIIPVFASTFLKPEHQQKPINKKRSTIIALIMLGVATLFYLGKMNVLANLLSLFAIIGLLNAYYFDRAGKWFMEVLFPKLEKVYRGFLVFALRKRNPVYFLIGTVFLLIFTVMFLGARAPQTLMWPDNDPKYINVLIELPIGTDITATDEYVKNIEADLYEFLEPHKAILESVLTNVGTGSQGDSDFFPVGETPNKSRITVTFLDYEERGDVNTSKILQEMNTLLMGKYPGAKISLEQNTMGPPSGKPINMEISGKDFDRILSITDSVEAYLVKADIPGIEGFKIDLDVGKPEMIIHIDREMARRFGLSTAQIATQIRTALFGKEISDFKIGEDEYPIQLRLKDEYRYDIPSLLNQKITFRSASTGKFVQVPISSVATIAYSTTYDAVKRVDRDRVVTLYSNVVEGYNANAINMQLAEMMEYYEMPEGYNYAFTGEQEAQAESMEFMMNALLIAIALILIILVTQFNSVVKPFIIIASIIFSTIGVFGGYATFKMDIVVMMFGVGIISLAGVVINNAIVLIDYIDLLKNRKRKELGLDENVVLPAHITKECIVEAGKTRLRPVLLTAITTILGLFPMALGMNFNFATLFSEFDPQFSIGGDMVAFWGPLSWTVIFGLTFATFLTLVIVPAMYYSANLVKIRIKGAHEIIQEKHI